MISKALQLDETWIEAGLVYAGPPQSRNAGAHAIPLPGIPESCFSARPQAAITPSSLLLDLALTTLTARSKNDRDPNGGAQPYGRPMKTFVVLCLMVCMSCGCTTLHPIGNAPSDLSQHFGDGGVLQPGDRVIITTVGGVRHHLRIRSVRDGVIYGDHESVPFSEIVSVDRRDFSAPKTTILVFVILGVVGTIAAAAHSAEHPNVGL